MPLLVVLHALLDHLGRSRGQETAQVGRDPYRHQAQWPAQVSPGSLHVGSCIVLHIKNEVRSHEKAQPQADYQQADATRVSLVPPSLVPQQHEHHATEQCCIGYRVIQSQEFCEISLAGRLRQGA